MWLARKGITVVKKLFNKQEMGVVRYYCGLISKKLFNEQEMCVVGEKRVGLAALIAGNGCG